MLVILISVLGTAIAMLGVLDHFMRWIGILAIAVPPVAGVYITDFLLFGRHRRDRDGGQSSGVSWVAFIAWAIGVGVAELANLDLIGLTAMPAIDGILTAMISYFIIRKIRGVVR